MVSTKGMAGAAAPVTAAFNSTSSSTSRLSPWERMSTVSPAAAASDTAERHGHPTHTLASYAFIVDCGAAAGPVLAYSVQDLWGMDAAYLAAAALLLCLLPLWMRREAAQARS